MPDENSDVGKIVRNVVGNGRIQRQVHQKERWNIRHLLFQFQKYSLRRRKIGRKRRWKNEYCLMSETT